MSTYDVWSVRSMEDATDDEAHALAEIGYGEDPNNLVVMHHGVLEALRKGYELGCAEAAENVERTYAWRREVGTALGIDCLNGQYTPGVDQLAARIRALAERAAD